MFVCACVCAYSIFEHNELNAFKVGGDQESSIRSVVRTQTHNTLIHTDVLDSEWNFFSFIRVHSFITT